MKMLQIKWDDEDEWKTIGKVTESVEKTQARHYHNVIYSKMYIPQATFRIIDIPEDGK